MHVTGRGDREISRVAGAQKGFVVREQLVAAGLGRSAIAHRLANGRLQPYHRCVYLVGRSSLEPLGPESAAVLYFRGHAVLSHRSAAAIWNLAETSATEVTLTLVGKRRRPPSGVRLHRRPSVDRQDLRTRHGLPVTSPARTLLDFAAEASDRELEKAVAEARVQRLTRESELRAAIERSPRSKGVARIRLLLEAEHGAADTRSKAELRLHELVRAAGLPTPIANAPLLGYTVDLFWPAQRLVVEFDGRRFHSSGAAFERDRRRDQVLVAAGYRVIRVTRQQLADEPLAVIARIAQALVQTAHQDA